MKDVLGMRYRPEIDGLRTIAVLPVVFFHAGFPGFKGGFLGVDIFFVISGYLITGLILKELGQGTFSFKNFYARRIRRILPALYTVTLATYCLAFCFLLPGEFTELCDSMLAMLAFCSNIYFYNFIDYFNPTAEFSPLLHTWSLSVEEQFYVIFPLIMTLLWKYRRRLALPALLLLLAASFYGAGWLHSLSAQAKFYLPWFRAWELCLGAACAFLHPRLPKTPVAGPLLSAAGLAVTLYALTHFDATKAFPGRQFFWPMLGVACIILFTSKTGLARTFEGQYNTPPPRNVKNFLTRQWHMLRFVHANNPVSYLLCLPPMVGVGLISYSLYLWHNPLFTYAKLSADKPSPVMFCALSAASALLAYGSWRFVEKPFRDRKKLKTRTVLFAVGVSSMLLLAAAYGGKHIKFPGADDDLLVTVAARSDYVVTAFNQHSGPFDPADARPKLLVMGDSQAQDFYNIIQEAGMFADFQKRTFNIPAVCQLDFTENRLDHVLEEYREMCGKISLDAVNASVRQADVIIIAFSWEDRILGSIADTVALLDISPEAKLFIIGKKLIPFNTNVRKYFHMKKTELALERVRQKTTNAKGILLDEQLSEKFPEEYIRMYPLFCDDNLDSCRLFNESGDLIFYDGVHLTQNGARYFGHTLAIQTALQRYAAPSPGVSQ